MFICETFVVSLSVINGYKAFYININKDGYTPIAIAGWSTPFGTAKCVGCSINGDMLDVQMLAEGAGTGEFKYKILFMKN